MIWTLGADQGMFPEGRFLLLTHGRIDSVRISNNARYASNFAAPTTKFSSDTNTLFLLNFDDNHDAYTTATVGVGGINVKQHIPLREGASEPWPGVEGQGIDGFTVEGGGIYVARSQRAQVSNIVGTGGGYGLWLRDMCHNSTVRNCKFTQGETSQFCVGVSESGRVYLENLQLTSEGVAAFVSANSRVVWRNSKASTTATVPAIFSFNGAVGDFYPDCDCHSVEFDDNSTDSAECAVIVEGLYYAHFENCTFFLQDAADPPLIVVGSDSGPLILDECIYRQSGSADENIRHLTSGSLTHHAYIKGIRALDTLGGPVVWSEKAGYAIVIDRDGTI
jgi:hypothetical protein